MRALYNVRIDEVTHGCTTLITMCGIGFTFDRTVRTLRKAILARDEITCMTCVVRNRP